MPVAVVDSSSIISCSTNCISWVFDELKEKGFEFVVPKAVEKEVIYSGLATQKYKLEAIRVMRHFITKSFTVVEDHYDTMTSTLLNYANTSFRVKNQNLKILQEADAQVAALAKQINADAIITDERTLRLLIESPDSLQGLMQHRLRTDVQVNQNSVHEFHKHVGNIPIFRSVDLVAYAISLGIFDEMIETTKVYDKNSRKDLIEGVLSALRFAGCGVSFEEINDYVNLLMRKKK
jgi:hypothetical protein